GVDTTFALQRHGFFPAGGGSVQLRVSGGAQLGQCAFDQRDAARRLVGSALLSGLHVEMGYGFLMVRGVRLRVGEEGLL
ncbi:RNA 3'-terminal phosphate cyclase, partial [Lysobacter sp. 2RAB21]